MVQDPSQATAQSTPFLDLLQQPTNLPAASIRTCVWTTRTCIAAVISLTVVLQMPGGNISQPCMADQITSCSSVQPVVLALRIQSSIPTGRFSNTMSPRLTTTPLPTSAGHVTASCLSAAAPASSVWGVNTTRTRSGSRPKLSCRCNSRAAACT